LTVEHDMTHVFTTYCNCSGAHTATSSHFCGNEGSGGRTSSYRAEGSNEWSCTG